MGIRLDQIQDVRLRESITRQLCSDLGPPPPCRSLEQQSLDRSGKPEARGPSRESDLHDEIIALCQSQGWYYVHSRMDRATTTGVGVADFIVALPGGAVVWLECKRKKDGKLTPAQAAALAQLRHLDHLACVVTDLESAKLALFGSIRQEERKQAVNQQAPV